MELLSINRVYVPKPSASTDVWLYVNPVPFGEVMLENDNEELPTLIRSTVSWVVSEPNSRNDVDV